VSWRDDLPPVRGRLLFDERLAPFTWFRVGGPADALFLPADEEDLADFLAALPSEVPVTVLGSGSNVIVRDGGIEGVVVRLAGRGFGEVALDEPAAQLIVGAAALDAAVARAGATPYELASAAMARRTTRSARPSFISTRRSGTAAPCQSTLSPRPGQARPAGPESPAACPRARRPRF